jgi:hypothetical protein
MATQVPAPDLDPGKARFDKFIRIELIVINVVLLLFVVAFVGVPSGLPVFTYLFAILTLLLPFLLLLGYISITFTFVWGAIRMVRNINR